MKKIFSILLVTVLILTLSSCKKSTNEIKTSNKEVKTMSYPMVTINLSNGKKIKLELYYDVAPISVNNFLKLANEGFYDGTIFHRVIQDFMIQTGGYFIKDGNQLYNKEASKIKGEFSLNGIENNISHVPGVISMARANDKNSATSQFFICVADCTFLDGSYAAFGKTVDQESLNNAIEISKYQTCNIGYGLTDYPVNDISILSIDIELNGYEIN